MAVGKAATHTTNSILAIEFVADESDDDVDVSAVTFYRNQRKFDNSDGYSVGFAETIASDGSSTVELDQVLPPATVIKLIPTFQA